MKSYLFFLLFLHYKEKSMRNSVIIVSGGLDSITLLYEKADDIALAISFDYGQNHSKNELPLAEYHCKKLGIPHITIPLKFMNVYLKSSLLEGSEAIPEGIMKRKI